MKHFLIGWIKLLWSEVRTWATGLAWLECGFRVLADCHGSRRRMNIARNAEKWRGMNAILDSEFWRRIHLELKMRGRVLDVILRTLHRFSYFQFHASFSSIWRRSCSPLFVLFSIKVSCKWYFPRSYFLSWHIEDCRVMQDCQVSHRIWITSCTFSLQRKNLLKNL